MSPVLNTPFRPWVPRWLQAMAIFSILLPVMLLNGAYTGSSVDLSSALGILSEDINMAYYAASVGMAAAYPLVPRIRGLITTKTVLLGGLLAQATLSILCAKTSSIEAIMIMSFLIGFLKAFALLELIVMLKPIFSKRNIRSEFYAYFYPIVFGIGQVSMILTAQLAYHYQWQYIYYMVAVLLMVAIAMVVICFRYGRRPAKIPWREIDFLSVALISVAMLLTVYVATYGKVRDWFASTDIVVCTLLILPLVVIFVRRQKRSTTPYLNFSVLQSIKSRVGFAYMMLAMILSASSYLVTVYTNSVLKLDSVHSNALNLWMIPGFVLSAVLCFWWFRLQLWRFRVLIFWGMACFSAYFALLYFGVASNGTYEYLFLPTVLKGAGMMMLLIAFGVYVAEDINPKLMISNAFFLVSFRSLLAPVLGSSLFTNAVYRLSQRGNMILGESIDMTRDVSVSTYSDALHKALVGGHAMPEAEQMAVQTLYQSVYTQSLLVSIKVILGYLLIFSLVVMIVSRFIPFHKTLKVKPVKSGDDMA